jgi:uncharacterized protein YjbI with pentapeptide repeats
VAWLASVAVLIALIGSIALIRLAYRRKWRWTGFYSPTGEARTLWDWLQLLIVPLALAVFGFGLTVAQSERDKAQEERRVAADRALADDDAREVALRSYLDRMSDLLLKHDLRRLRSPDASARVLGRTLTHTVLRRLDGRRKGVVVRFLRDAKLLTKDPDNYLDEADLSNAALRNAALEGAGLRDASLRGADLRGSSRSGVDFLNADLRGARFGRSTVDTTSFDGADLRGADFNRSSIFHGSFDRACVAETSFYAARLDRPFFSGAVGQEVDLRSTVIRGAQAAWSDARLWNIRRDEHSKLAGLRQSRPRPSDVPCGNVIPY